MSSLPKNTKAEATDKKGPKLLKKTQRPASIPEILGLDVREKNAAQVSEPIKGICAHCVNASECAYPKDAGRPTLFCDEFEGFEPRAMARVSSIHEKCKAAPQADSSKELALYKGLCRTCANNDGCDFPKPEGGVWRCEEYK